jgi:hypothetical protein
MENGLTPQFHEESDEDPAPLDAYLASAPKSILRSMGMIMAQIRAATGRVT